MAKLLLINTATSRPGINAINDIVDIKDDSHIYSPAEIAGFDIKTVTETPAQIEALKATTVDKAGKTKMDAYVGKYKYKVKDDTKTDFASVVEFKADPVVTIGV